MNKDRVIRENLDAGVFISSTQINKNVCSVCGVELDKFGNCDDLNHNDIEGLKNE